MTVVVRWGEKKEAVSICSFNLQPVLYKSLASFCSKKDPNFESDGM